MPPRRRPAAIMEGRRGEVHRGVRAGALRRPARAEARDPPVPKEVEWLPLSKITLGELNQKQKVVLEGRYWKSPVLVAGETRGVIVNEADATWRIWVTGTQSESLLREVSGRCKELRVHVCPDPCDRLVWAKDLIHGLRYHVQGDSVEDWWTNLEEVPREKAGPREGDPLHRLREEMGAREKEGDLQYSPEGVEPPARPGEVAEEKAVKKGKKKKAKLKVQLEAPLKEVFKRTALDPDADVRVELMRKARKIRRGKKRKKKGSRSRSRGSSREESGESTESSSLGEKRIATSELFESERRSLRLWRRVPGALTHAAILDMQEQMLTAHGYQNRPVAEGASGSRGGTVFSGPSATTHGRSTSPGITSFGDDCGPMLARPHCGRVGRGQSTTEGPPGHCKRYNHRSRQATGVGRSGPAVPPDYTGGRRKAGRELQAEDRVFRRNTGRWHWEARDSFKGGKGKDKGRREKGKGDGKFKDKGNRKGDGKKKEDKGDKE